MAATDCCHQVLSACEVMIVRCVKAADFPECNWLLLLSEPLEMRDGLQVEASVPYGNKSIEMVKLDTDMSFLICDKSSQRLWKCSS